MKTILVDAWNTFVTEEGINLDLKKLLDSYPNNKIILTNATEEELVKFGIVNMPYPVFSLAHNPNKTDANYFVKMLQHFNLKTEDVVYFEHNVDAVTSAKSIGISTFHYNKLEKLDYLTTFLNSNL
jgi:FMN phosphatase YigB (HAD superfamily)